jgi:hypothetical protein
MTLAACGRVTAPSKPVTLGLTEVDRFSAGLVGAPMPLASDLRQWQRFDAPVLGGWVERALANKPVLSSVLKPSLKPAAVVNLASAQPIRARR